MKIAMVSLSYLPISEKSMGGLEVVVWELTKQLKKMGHRVTMFGLSDSKLDVETVGIVSSQHLREDGLALDNKYFVRRYATYQTLALVEALKKSREFDCIHVNIAEWQQAFLYRNNENMVVTAHGNYMTPRLTKMVFDTKPGTKLACVSNFVADNFFPDYKNKFVIHNGIDLDEFKPNFVMGDYLVWLGRISPIKNPKLAIELAQKTGHKLIIAGGIDYQEFFDQDVKPFLSNDIQYVGPIFGQEKNKLLANAKALLFTSNIDESFGLVAVEAMVCGTPVIALNKGALHEVIEDGKTGFVVNDLTEMVKKLNEVGLISRKYCREWVENNFSSKKMAEEYVELYKKEANV